MLKLHLLIYHLNWLSELYNSMCVPVPQTSSKPNLVSTEYWLCLNFCQLWRENCFRGIRCSYVSCLFWWHPANTGKCGVAIFVLSCSLYFNYHRPMVLICIRNKIFPLVLIFVLIPILNEQAIKFMFAWGKWAYKRFYPIPF